MCLWNIFPILWRCFIDKKMEVRGQSYNDESLGQTEYQLRNNSWLGKKKTITKSLSLLRNIK